MAAEPVPPEAIRLPGARVGPLETLARRLALAVGAILLVSVITYLQRDGYFDAAQDGLSFLDAVYYATVSVTTTGYGDIVPRSDAARLVSTLLITPIRVVFLIVLVGTTIEILTERTRHELRVKSWSRRLSGHTIVCGFGTKARSAVAVLEGKGVDRQDIVIIDKRAEAVEEAASAGFAAVHGDATQTRTLRRARVEDAAAVIVAPDRDDSSVLITLTARELNKRATIVAAVREEENAHLLRESGATSVITTSGAAGRLLGLATQDPAAVEVLEDLLAVGEGVDIVEREVDPAHVGGPPRTQDGALVLAVVRNGEVLRFDDPRAAVLEPGDRLVCVHGHRRR